MRYVTFLLTNKFLCTVRLRIICRKLVLIDCDNLPVFQYFIISNIISNNICAQCTTASTPQL